MGNTGFYHDIDIYGKQSAPGVATEYFDADAVNNALILFLSSSRGDFLRNPGAGGVINWSVFKNLNETNINKLAFIIKNAINTYFTPAIELKSINLNPDYEHRFLEISITYEDKTTLIVNQVSVYTDTSYSYQLFTYEDITLTEQKLLAFIIMQKTDLTNTKLLYNSEDGIWYFGKFKLVNFTTSDSYFDAILAAANT